MADFTSLLAHKLAIVHGGVHAPGVAGAGAALVVLGAIADGASPLAYVPVAVAACGLIWWLMKLSMSVGESRRDLQSHGQHISELQQDLNESKRDRAELHRMGDERWAKVEGKIDRVFDRIEALAEAIGKK